ncbi:MAG: M23 family metallopeptidase, partial [Oscillospiraceae bacterium]
PRLEEAAYSQPGVAVESTAPSSSLRDSSSSSTQPAKAADALPESAVPASSEKLSFVLPINGEIFAEYSNGQLTRNETLGDWRTHNGIDIKAAEKTSIKAVTGGEITMVAPDPLWGNVVEIKHAGGLVSRYCGLDKDIPVHKGDTVKTGQVIGTLGYVPAENLSPSHLHFEMKKDGKWVDPILTMGKK